MKTRTQIINKLIKVYGFQSYLEIGVAVPTENFDIINASNKESVDPRPSGECTYIMTSDEFFLNYAGNRKYDIIFVDGMHTAEQSYVDVQNAIEHLNEGGFIVMHDCNPPTEYYARSYEDFLMTKGAWNGTVFRGFIRLKHELKDWSCFTINEDWGCGILTKRKILENKLIDFDINNLSWNEFDENRKGLLQLIRFKEYDQILMKDIILEYIIEQFGDKTSKEKRNKHYSYCMFPEENCTCKDLNEITCSTQLISGGYIDSFSMVVVLIFLEKTFNIKIPDIDAKPENFNSVNKMAELVNKFKKTKLYAFGDSHSRIGWNITVPNLQIINGKNGAYTMARFGAEKLNLFNIKNEGVNEDDAVCFAFGEIDCRSHLCKPENFKIYESLIDEIVSRYFEAIKLNVEQYRDITTMVFNVMPAIRVTQSFVQTPSFPHIGSDIERKTVTQYMNVKIKEFCEKYNYMFIDIHAKYSDDDGLFRPELKDSSVHMNNGIYLFEFLNKLFN